MNAVLYQSQKCCQQLVRAYEKKTPKPAKFLELQNIPRSTGKQLEQSENPLSADFLLGGFVPGRRGTLFRRGAFRPCVSDVAAPAKNNSLRAATEPVVMYGLVFDVATKKTFRFDHRATSFIPLLCECASSRFPIYPMSICPAGHPSR